MPHVWRPEATYFLRYLAGGAVLSGAVEAFKEAIRDDLVVLVFNLATNEDDPLLGFTSSWLRVLADHVGEVRVLTMYAGPADLPRNVAVRSAGRELGLSKVERLLRFYRQLAEALGDRRVNVCFSHMMPLFSALAGPVLKTRGIPLVTWYAHPQLTGIVRVAHWFSTYMVTSIPEAYPYRTDKVLPIGQGIDAQLFSPPDVEPEGTAVVLCVGRISPVKSQLTLIEAAAVLRSRGVPFQVLILGPVVGRRTEEYRTLIAQRIEHYALEDQVRVEPPVPIRQLASWYRRCAVHVNLTATGFGDKVALEAMMCGRPSVVANEGFCDTLGDYAQLLLFRYGDACSLADRLEAVLRMTPQARRSVGLDLRRRAERMHGLDGMVTRLMSVLRVAAS